MAITVISKLKYTTPFTSPRHSYRSRTGPVCCNVNCGGGIAGAKRRAAIRARNAARAGRK